MAFNIQSPAPLPLKQFVEPKYEGPQPVSSDSEPRTIVLCFDGTGNKFGENSNVVRFFHALKKDQPGKQLVYYQPGIGTYNKRQFFTRTVSAIASTLDQGIALHLNDHVKEGYQYVMQNYRKGDKICLFGFSRGAHTARVVAGMLYKVGILPPHNDQQLDFAFSVYQTTGDEGIELSKEFRKTFAMPVTVEFVGVWDTVSSVGIIPRAHPYTSVNYAVKTFRHALALDERRARFRPNTWNEPTLDYEQELDVDEPNLPERGKDTPRDEWTYQPPPRNYVDVEEVWFAGTHADVGGGSHHNRIRDSLSYIPLRWMIKEAIVARTGILFDQAYLQTLGFDFQALARELQPLNLTLKDFGFDIGTPTTSHATVPTPNSTNSAQLSPDPFVLLSPLSLPSPSPPASPDPPHLSLTSMTNFVSSTIASGMGHVHVPRIAIKLRHARDREDALAKVWDQLLIARGWWALEVLPLLATYQTPDGTWIRKRMRNFGQGRYIPFQGDEIRVHESVRDRMETALAEDGIKYKPAAYNWDIAQSLGMINYVS